MMAMIPTRIIIALSFDFPFLFLTSSNFEAISSNPVVFATIKRLTAKTTSPIISRNAPKGFTIVRVCSLEVSERKTIINMPMAITTKPTMIKIRPTFISF